MFCFVLGMMVRVASLGHFFRAGSSTDVAGKQRGRANRLLFITFGMDLNLDRRSVHGQNAVALPRWRVLLVTRGHISIENNVGGCDGVAVIFKPSLDEDVTLYANPLAGL